MIIDGKEKVVLLRGQEFHCALSITMHFIGGKWKSVILWYLRKDIKRFNEIKKHIPDITEKMLSLQLRSLEEDGIIKRKIYPEVPPRVEYSLTDFGKTMVPMIEAIAKWGRELGQNEGKVIDKDRKKVKKKVKA
ncbi:MAG: winged helix-turn-helix transcriptional regulator [Flavobacteriales bacterium]